MKTSNTMGWVWGWVGVWLAACQGTQAPGGPESSAREVRSEPVPEAADSAAAAGETRPVFSLLENRHLAHLQRGDGLVISAAGPGLAKYLRFGRPGLGWRLKQSQDGRAVASPEGSGPLSFPLRADQVKEGASLFLRVYAPKAGSVSAELNGKKGSATALQAGWQTATLALPAGALRAGENDLSFTGLAGHKVEWIQVGGALSEEAPRWYDATAGELVLPDGAGADYVIQVPAEGVLRGQVKGAGCEVAVSVEAADGATVTARLQGTQGADLRAVAGKIARLSLRGQGCAEARLAGAALAVPGPKVERPGGKPPKYVVMWIMDTLRADKMRVYDPKARAETPVFDELAKQGVVFENAYSQGNESRAGHASIWTSLYPSNHRMINSKAKLAPELVTIDEPMKDAGLFVSGISCNGYVTAKWGFGTRWDRYRNHIHEGGGVRGEDILNAGIKSVEDKRANPFFLYLGTVDTHVSWRAHEPWLSKYDPGPYKGPWTKVVSGVDLEKTVSGALKITERDKVRALAMYDANVSYQDELVGRLIAQLKEWGIFEETMLVFSADHGEELWEHGQLSHGGSQRETLLRVPLIVYYPPLFPAGRVVEGADTMDIMPTILDALGQPLPESIQGASLLPLASGEGRGYPRPSLSSMYEKSHAMRLAGWKMVVTSAGVASLYHIEADPNEARDLLKERPLERRFLTDALSTFLVYQKQWKKWRWGVASNVSAQFSADLE